MKYYRYFTPKMQFLLQLLSIANNQRNYLNLCLEPAYFLAYNFTKMFKLIYLYIYFKILKNYYESVIFKFI